ncbi:MAG: Rne/Rng family ribonuclease [Candidatus Marinimicrobia bacterium]|nr:Rne/Rng family ribonuclease [Candidatus Neomarinimicrobiota bacterium]
MDKVILMSKCLQETRIAILEDGKLVELFIEKSGKSRMVGNIYKGKVENVVEGIRAAFVDIGYGLNAFLPFSEVNNPASIVSITEDVDREDDEEIEILPSQLKEPDTGEINIKTGQDILVQVIKEPFADKGPRVTTDISLPGRFLVLVPNISYVGVSKKITSRSERKRLKDLAKSIKPDNFGLIIRTVAEGKEKDTLKKDLDDLLKKWERIEKKAKTESAPVCVYEDIEMVSSVMRDLLTPDVSKVVVDSKSLYKKIHSYVSSVSPDMVKRLEYYSSKTPIFDFYGVEKEIRKSLNKRVWLKSGGFIVIEHTEAMTTIDVNSGKFIGKKDYEENALKINIQAAYEIARQVRLRDIGGIIVIDFIDMGKEENKKKVFHELLKEFRKDRAKVAIAPISDFGLLEMTRQRTRLNLFYTVSEECPSCHGTGRIMSKDSFITQIESWLRRFRAESRELKLTLQVHPYMGEYLKNEMKKIVKKLQWKNLILLKIEENPSLRLDEFRFISQKTGEDITDKY